MGERADGRFVFQDDAVEFGDVELVGGRAGRDGEGEALAGEDLVGEVEDEGFDVGLDRGEGEIGYFPTRG